MKSKEINLLKDINTQIDRSSADDPSWLKSLREDGLSWLSENGFPTTKDEEWKYTNVGPVLKKTFNLPTDNSLKDTNTFKSCTAGDQALIVFVNGIFNEELSDRKKLPEGVVITTLREAISLNGTNIKDLFEKCGSKEKTAFASLNHVLSDDGIFINVAKATASKESIHILHVTEKPENEIMTVPRTVIQLAESSEITVVESHIGFNNKASYFANALTDIFLEENSTLHYTKIQSESLKATHIGSTRVWIERNANFDGFSFMCGANITRNDLDIVINGEGCNANLNGLYVLSAEQHADNHTSVDHRFPNCTSNQLYKGLLHDSSRAVFNGKIFVKPIAQLTNSYQLNKNLLLGDNCRVDTKPQLEIFADDVKCTHGATIGQLDEDEIFYLQSRAISRKEAIRILSHGFINDTVDHIQDEHVKGKIKFLLCPILDKIR